MNTISGPSIAEQIAELKRERSMRQRVYPKWVAADRMKQEEADRNMTRLDAAIATLERQQMLALE